MRCRSTLEYPIKGVYREIVAPERLVMTMDCSEHPQAWHDPVNPDRRKGERNPAGEMLSTVTFEDLGGKTRLDMQMLFPSAKAREFTVEKYGAVEGLNQTLGRLEEHLAKM